VCAVVPKGGGFALRVRVMWRTVCSRVCSHIKWLGWEVSVCSDRLGHITRVISFLSLSHGMPLPVPGGEGKLQSWSL